MKITKLLPILSIIPTIVYTHFEATDRKDTICKYYMDENRGYVSRCPDVKLTNENQHVRFTGQQVDQMTNEDVKFLEIVPPSSITFVPSQNIFTYFINLENLILKSVNIQNLDYIYDCYAIVYLTLTNNFIKEIIFDAFFTCRDLIVLDLSKNYITKIHENAFSQTKNLEELNLSENQVTSLPRSLLKPLIKLRILDVSHNRIKTVAFNALNDLFDLNYLDMSHNLFSSLDARFFDFLMSLETLKLAGNDIVKLMTGIFKSLKRLRSLDVSGNKLKLLDGELLAKNVELREIYMNACSIKFIGSGFFDNLQNLKVVAAKDNKCVNGIFKGKASEITEKFSRCLSYENYHEIEEL